VPSAEDVVARAHNSVFVFVVVAISFACLVIFAVVVGGETVIVDSTV